jgi:DNA-binding response OmpR family regulator
MLTCKGSLVDYKEALDAGAQDYIVKPVRMDELVRRIKLVLPENFKRIKFG